MVLVGCGESQSPGCCLRNNIEVVKQHLAAGTDVNVKNHRFLWAAMRGYKEISMP